MPAPERGSSPAGFRAQVLARLRNQAQVAGVSAQRLQQRVAFERFLARLGPTGAWVLKGGFALELRYGWGGRPTRDIDLRVATTFDAALAELRKTLAESAGADHFSFELAEAGQELQGAPGGTQRLEVHARLAGETLARFHLDVSSGDALITAPDTLEGSDLLTFAGVAPLRFPAYPVVQHLAELRCPVRADLPHHRLLPLSGQELGEALVQRAAVLDAPAGDVRPFPGPG